MEKADSQIEHALAEPKQETGVPIPLFERLVDLEPEEDEEYPPKKYYSYEETLLSIEREINRILSARSTAKKKHYQNLIQTPDNRGLPELFGLPDFSHYDAASKESWDDIGEICARTLQLYEPRLKNIVVTPTAFDAKTQSLSAQIDAELELQNYTGEVSFATIINLNK